MHLVPTSGTNVGSNDSNISVVVEGFMPNASSTSVGIPLANEAAADHFSSRPRLSDFPIEANATVGQFSNSTLSILRSLV